MIERFSSRRAPLDRAFLLKRLTGARSYKRIAGYFRSSIFEVLDEAIDGLESIRIVCNSDLDPNDVKAAKSAGVDAKGRAAVAKLKAAWNERPIEAESVLRRERYQRLTSLLASGKLQVRVVGRDKAFLHGKAGIIEARDGSKCAFIGSANETREAFEDHYELIWEDRSADAVAWTEAEFDALWDQGFPLPEAIVSEIARCAGREEITREEWLSSGSELQPAAALVEAPIHRGGEQLQSWQRDFVGLFMRHVETYGKARILLADEVGVGKTLSLGASAVLSALLTRKPSIIFCPPTLKEQWQVELLDKLGAPTAAWDSQKKAWRDHLGHLIPGGGPEHVARCPYAIGLISTGLVVANSAEVEHLLSLSPGCLVLDEAHKARVKRNGDEESDGRLIVFMRALAARSTHVLLGTATPVQTRIEDLWDLLGILAQGAEHVLGREIVDQGGNPWMNPQAAFEILAGLRRVTDEEEAWSLLRNPLPPPSDDLDGGLIARIRDDLDVPPYRFFSSAALAQLGAFTRRHFRERLQEVDSRRMLDGRDLTFFRRTNPIIRHVVLRKRRALEELGLMPKIGVNIHPLPSHRLPGFERLGLRTSLEFDRAYQAAIEYTGALARRMKKRGAGFMQSLMLQRLCSSYQSGLLTATRILDRRQEDIEEDEDAGLADSTGEMSPEEEKWLRIIVDELTHNRKKDPKFDAVLHFLVQQGWAKEGCIIFSQYYDTAAWIAAELAPSFADQTIALYAGSGKSRLLRGGLSAAVERDAIKEAVRRQEIRIVVATDAACEGLNLQALGTLINVDLPWNPIRLEQRIGRIKRFGQVRAEVEMLNLVYHETRDEVVYARLSERMQKKFDIFGSLPDVIRDEWIADIESMSARMDDYIKRRPNLDPFSMVYDERLKDLASGKQDDGWESCSRVLSRRDFTEMLSAPWNLRTS